MLRHKVAAHTRQYQSKHHHEHHYSGPFFEGPLNTSAGALNVGVHLHTEGVFDCRVGMLKDKTVSHKNITNLHLTNKNKPFTLLIPLNTNIHQTYFCVSYFWCWL